jgi:hypothetical protein
MMRSEESFPPLTIANPNKAWVSAEIDNLIREWETWNDHCQNIEDSSDYNPQTSSDAIKDGWENIHKHEILREKTLVFMRNHFSGAEFVLAKWKTHPHEDVCSRLKSKVPVWIHRLEMLKASMGYALVPDGFWKSQGKKLLESLSKTTAEKAIDVAASYLRNPLAD